MLQRLSGTVVNSSGKYGLVLKALLAFGAPLVLGSAEEAVGILED
jgi:hypothetical protein